MIVIWLTKLSGSAAAVDPEKSPNDLRRHGPIRVVIVP
jgi:hypothetical protein